MSASPDRMIAGLIGGRYEITGLIASGGMGSVYRARDTVLDRTVALKVLRTGSEDAEFAARFRSEATNAARLSHPNIVQVYDFGYSDGAPFMAMEFVDGQNLREILQQRGVLRPDVAARVAQQVASALEHARRAGIVHRDVKPENILITTEGQVKVADFGLSRALAESRATQAGMLMGTAHYLAPEQVRGGQSDHRADVYSLGIVLFETLTGRVPFGGESPVAIAYRHTAEDVPSVMGLNEAVPRELDLIVERATRRDPDERYASAGMMAEALRLAVPPGDTAELGGLVHHTEAIPILDHETMVVQRVPQRTVKRRRKRRRLVAVLGILALVAAGLLAAGERMETVPVADVRGLSQDRARQLLVADGFEVGVELRNHPTVAPGNVIAQEPAAGAELRKGTLVTLQVSLGPATFVLDDVRGKTFRQAERILRAQGVDVRRVDVFSDEVKRLLVIGQDPAAGVFVKRGTPVTLTVSKGPELVKVPGVVGDPEQQAKDDLEAAGFEVRVSRKYDAKVPKGRVISQSPAAGARVKKESVVALVISRGAPEVIVPSLRCMTRRQAEDKLAATGLKPEFSGDGGRVVDQEPAPGTRAPRGSKVSVFMGTGSFC